MGFFSKNKKEEDLSKEIMRKVMSSIIKSCPLCGAENFYVADRISGHKDFGNGVSSASAMFDLTTFTNGTTGACTRCGFISHGQVFYKGKDREDSLTTCFQTLQILNIWNEAMREIMRDTSTDDAEKTNRLNQKFQELSRQIRKDLPEYCEKVDFLKFIKVTFEFKFKCEFPLG